MVVSRDREPRAWTKRMSGEGQWLQGVGECSTSAGSWPGCWAWEAALALSGGKNAESGLPSAWRGNPGRISVLLEAQPLCTGFDHISLYFLLQCHRLTGLSAVSLHLSPWRSFQPPNCSCCPSVLPCSTLPLVFPLPKWPSNMKIRWGHSLEQKGQWSLCLSLKSKQWRNLEGVISAHGWRSSTSVCSSACTLGSGHIVPERHCTSQACVPLYVLFLLCVPFQNSSPAAALCEDRDQEGLKEYLFPFYTGPLQQHPPPSPHSSHCLQYSMWGDRWKGVHENQVVVIMASWG